MGTKQITRVRSVEELIQDPLSKTQKMYVLNEWLSELNIAFEMEHTLKLVMIEFSEFSLKEKLHSVSIKYNNQQNVCKSWTHSDLFALGVVVNRCEEEAYAEPFVSRATFSDFTYYFHRESGDNFNVEIKLCPVMSVIKRPFSSKRICWNLENTIAPTCHSK
eukprot:470413_1